MRSCLCLALSMASFLVASSRASNWAMTMPMRASCTVMPSLTASRRMSRVFSWLLLVLERRSFFTFSSLTSRSAPVLRTLFMRPSRAAENLRRVSSSSGKVTLMGFTGATRAMNIPAVPLNSFIIWSWGPARLGLGCPACSIFLRRSSCSFFVFSIVCSLVLLLSSILASLVRSRSDIRASRSARRSSGVIFEYFFLSSSVLSNLPAALLAASMSGLGFLAPELALGALSPPSAASLEASFAPASFLAPSAGTSALA
mmetsp:Transcript_24732/g.62670  ORF Transcript_24732/g.62670 Transcript_24732/m.62670 type:complete len:257 (-) Transcript_24732:115-885(-)